VERPILITGGHGMIGAAVHQALGEHDVHAESAGRELADLLRPGAAARLIDRTRPTTLVHCAWNLRPEAVADERSQAAWVDASVALLEAFGCAGGRHAVVIGTCAEYSWGDDVLIEGVTSLEPQSVYGRAKRTLHIRAAKLAAEQGWTLGWPRVFWVYGPRERPGRLVPSVVSGLLAGQHVSCTHGRQQRDYLYSGDVGQAVAGLTLAGYEGAVNIASGQALAVRDLVTAIADELERPELIDWGALASREDEPARLTGDRRRLATELPNWKPVSLVEGVRRTVDWWRGR
jgi:nucleoside-diphosphate-sugar epimerase